MPVTTTNIQTKRCDKCKVTKSTNVMNVNHVDMKKRKVK